jgi:integrase
VNQPVEYAVAVDRFLSAATLAAGSRRIYRIALTTWAWALADRVPPTGEDRRNAPPPVLPLALLDDPLAGTRLRQAFDTRCAAIGARTANRELSVLVGAVAWWRAQGWLTGDPTTGLRPLPTPRRPGGDTRIGAREARCVLDLPVPLREQTLWHLLYETGAPIERALALDVDDLNAARRCTRGPQPSPLHWGEGTARLLTLLVLGRVDGPLFTTSRGRLSYRRAAEIFRAATRPLDPQGRGWTLHQLRLAGRRQSSG